MRHLTISLITSLFFLVSLSSNAQTPNRLEHQVIKLALDELKPSRAEKDNIGAIFYDCSAHYHYIPDYKPGNIIAWFKYRHDDKYITINYLS
jgi:hypothetical protein